MRQGKASEASAQWDTSHGVGAAAVVPLAALLVVLTLLTLGTPPRARAAGIVPATSQVASATAGDFRVTFTATPRPDDGSGMPVANVEVTGYLRSDGQWRSIGKQVVPGQWFWNVVSEPGAVCDLTIATKPQLQAAITLRASQSLGCGKTAAFHAQGDRLVPG